MDAAENGRCNGKKRMQRDRAKVYAEAATVGSNGTNGTGHAAWLDPKREPDAVRRLREERDILILDLAQLLNGGYGFLRAALSQKAREIIDKYSKPAVLSKTAATVS
jgi:hypothetical protein